MRLVVPGQNAGRSHDARHRRAVEGAQVQKLRDQLGVAGDKSRAQTWRIRAFRQAPHRHQPSEIGAPEFSSDLQRTMRWADFFKINFAIALVGEQHESVTITLLKQPLPAGTRGDRAGRIIGRTHEHQLHIAPHRVRDFVPSVFICRGVEINVIRPRATEQRRALVHHVKRVGHEHRRVFRARIHDCLREGIQRFLGANHRQHLRFGIERGQ